MEGVDSPAQVADKGKGKAPEMEEDNEDDSSDESGVEDQVRLHNPRDLSVQSC